jgi:hypothetical protein
MMTMLDLKNTTALVKSILEQDKQCRNSDSFLYLKVLSVTAKQKGIDLEKMTVPYFLLNLHGAGLPPFESVRRARQKVQERNPHLAACERVECFRAENESAFREYARGEA